MGAFTACLAGKVLEDCLETLANEILALAGDYLDVFDSQPSWQQMNAQHISDYGVDMPLPTIEFRLENCSLEYRWETQTEWQSAGVMSAENCASLVGPQGPQGPQGVQGLPGVDGVDGVDGQDCDCGNVGKFNVSGSTDETPYTSDNEICGGMLAWRDYAFDWANFIIDQREAELSGAELVIRLVGMFPFLDPLADSLASFLVGLGEYGVALARVQINDPDFQTDYMCSIYNLVYPAGRYTEALHGAIADEYLTTIPNQTQLMDHMLWFIGWEKLNRVFEAGTTEPSDTCELLCGDPVDPNNPLNLNVLKGEICSVTEITDGWRYTFVSLEYNGAWEYAIEYPGFDADEGMNTRNRGNTLNGCDWTTYNNHTPYMIREGQTGGQVIPLNNLYVVKWLSAYGTAGQYYHTFDIGPALP